MIWNVDIEREVSSIKTFQVEAETHSEAIKQAIYKAAETDWSDEPTLPKYHTMHVDLA